MAKFYGFTLSFHSSCATKKQNKNKRVNKLHGDNIQSIKWHGPQNKLLAACEEMNKWLKLQLLQKAKSIQKIIMKINSTRGGQD